MKTLIFVLAVLCSTTCFAQPQGFPTWYDAALAEKAKALAMKNKATELVGEHTTTWQEFYDAARDEWKDMDDAISMPCSQGHFSSADITPIADTIYEYFQIENVVVGGNLSIHAWEYDGPLWWIKYVHNEWILGQADYDDGWFQWIKQPINKNSPIYRVAYTYFKDATTHWTTCRDKAKEMGEFAPGGPKQIAFYQAVCLFWEEHYAWMAAHSHDEGTE